MCSRRSSRCCRACSRSSPTGKFVTPAGEYPRIPYKEALLKYGSDKPDLRNPLLIHDVGEQFRGSGFGLFAGLVEKGGGGPRCCRRRTPPKRAANSSTR